jgi:hypothetical protein
MSGIFGGGGSGKGSSGGKGTPENVDIPPFISAGGVTPQQQNLGQYSYGQDLTAQASLFGGSGTGDSTMATQGAAGARNTAAEQMAGMSDTNQKAMYDLYGNDVSAISQELQNASTTNTSPSLGSLAEGSGFGTNTNASLT